MWWRILPIFVLLGCGGGSDQDRLVPPGDPDHAELERPEEGGECAIDGDCEPSCVHACAPVDPGPVTCPREPPPRPTRLDGAACVCLGDVCAWN